MRKIIILIMALFVVFFGSASIGYADLNNSLVHYYNGESVTDSYGTANLINSNTGLNTTVCGKSGGGFQFGGNANLTGTTSADFDLSNDYNRTLCAWVKNNGTSDTGVLYSKRSPTGGGWSISTDSSHINRLVTLSSPAVDSSINSYFPDDEWVFDCFVKNGTSLNITRYRNGINIKSDLTSNTNWNSGNPFVIGAVYNDLWGTYFKGCIDEVKWWNRALSGEEIFSLYPSSDDSIAVVTNSLNFTSDSNQSCGYNGASYITCGPTEDGTPTFKFNTYGNSSCKIWNEAKNYSNLSSQGVSDCSTTGTSSHICTYPQPLSNITHTLYISCKSGVNETNNFNLYPSNLFNISILRGVYRDQIYANEAMNFGITTSQIWPGALIYTTQPVYVRTKGDNQAIATFDKVAVYGNQRWAFNYMIENESSIGAFYNISPVFYFWEGTNLTYGTLASEVSSFINSTKN